MKQQRQRRTSTKSRLLPRHHGNAQRLTWRGSRRAAERALLSLWRAIVRTDSEIDRLHVVLANKEAAQDRRRMALSRLVERVAAAKKAGAA